MKAIQLEMSDKQTVGPKWNSYFPSDKRATGHLGSGSVGWGVILCFNVCRLMKKLALDLSRVSSVK